MRVFPLVVFAAAAGIGSGMASFKYASQLNYENAMLTLRVHQAERRIAALQEQQDARRDAEDSRTLVTDGHGGEPRTAKRGLRR